MSLHAQRQSAQTTQHQMGIEWTEHCAKQNGVVTHLVQQGFLSANHCTRKTVSMTTNILCCAMYDEVKAMLDGSDQIGRCKGAINNGHCFYFACSCSNGIEIHDFDQWIGDGFYIDHIRLFLANDIGSRRAAKIGQYHLNSIR